MPGRGGLFGGLREDRRRGGREKQQIGMAHWGWVRDGGKYDRKQPSARAAGET
jgi:hypothetical protein